MEDSVRTYKNCGLLLALVLVGCATPGVSRIDYSPPSLVNGKVNEFNTEESFDVVWDRLVSRLATGFFVINNIDKASRLINVSFSSDSPEEYVDCGQSTRKFKYKDEEQTYTYKVAEDSFYKYSGTWGPYNNLPSVADVFRDVSLDGRINVFVAPNSPTGTKVSANVKYVLSVEVTGVAVGYNAFGQQLQQIEIPRTESDISLTTSESATKNWGSGGSYDPVTCGTTGALEKTIIDMVRK